MDTSRTAASSSSRVSARCGVRPDDDPVEAAGLEDQHAMHLADRLPEAIDDRGPRLQGQE
jgi:hypothetical protein